MKIPQDAIIEEQKLSEYLLAPRNEDDKSGFLALGGFTLPDTTPLRNAILKHIGEHNASPQRQNTYGRIYAVSGDLVGVNGYTLEITTIWILLNHDERFHFVTLKPERRGENNA
ncbi:MAG: DUF6883 domain-containing protein [Chthonomonadales bacterium]